jgi:hypothetical protein
VVLESERFCFTIIFQPQGCCVFWGGGSSGVTSLWFALVPDVFMCYSLCFISIIVLESVGFLVGGLGFFIADV